MPATLSLLTALTRLALSSNFLTGTLPDLSPLYLLADLDVASNQLVAVGAQSAQFPVSSPALARNCIPGCSAQHVGCTLTRAALVDLYVAMNGGCVVGGVNARVWGAWRVLPYAPVLRQRWRGATVPCTYVYVLLPVCFLACVCACKCLCGLRVIVCVCLVWFACDCV